MNKHLKAMPSGQAQNTLKDSCAGILLSIKIGKADLLIRIHIRIYFCLAVQNLVVIGRHCIVINLKIMEVSHLLVR